MRALLVLLALAATAWAQGSSQSYRVKQDDTLDVIAAEFYGDRAQANLIVAENKLKKKVQAGQRLRIPITKEITTQKGDTYQSLAQTYLGNARRAVMLADFNERDHSDVPAIGTQITIPIQITHVAQAEESIASVAAHYWGDAKQADMLQRYNLLDKPMLEKGDSIIVPMLKIRMRKPPALDTESKARRDEQRVSAAEADRALPTARTAWLQGDFASVKAALEPIAERVDYLQTPVAMEVGLLLAKSYLAFDDAKRAKESFLKMLERKPSHTLSGYHESPKVIAVWKEAGGQVTQ